MFDFARIDTGTQRRRRRERMQIPGMVEIDGVEIGVVQMKKTSVQGREILDALP